MNPLSRCKQLLKNQQARVEWIVGGIDEGKITPREATLIEGMEKQSENGRYLSERQMEWLEDIYRNKGR